jgi:beta-galactosidase
MTFNFKAFLFILNICLFFNINTITAQQKHVFSLSKTEFLLDGKPFQIIGGELHPARIPKMYWQHRIQMAKAMGCNTIAVYIFWNYHESSAGVYDFTTDNKNLAEFLALCQKEKMWVLFRPGPYVCGEWDFGGIPTYLLKHNDLKIRCTDTRYLAAVQKYITALAKVIKPFQCQNGGPIIMLQIENEYGSYANDKAYLLALKKAWQAAGITVPYYTADGATPYMLEAGSIEEAAIGLDSGSNEGDFEQAKKANPNVPAFSSETYPGWLTHWGEKFAKPDTADLKKEVTYLLENKKSFNFYVIHGGTNFGYTAGANANSATSYQPDITSYDYDAPINEQGLPTAKYFMLRNLIKKYVDYSIPEVPSAIKTITVPAIKMNFVNHLWQFKIPTIRTVQPQTFESLGQNQGIAIYKTKLIGHKSGKLKIWEPHDFALVFLNGKFIDTVFRDGGKWEVILPKTDVVDPILEIVVEGMGHINYGQFMIDRKGITDRVTLNSMTLMNWETTLIPLDENFIQKMPKKYVTNSSLEQYCNFYSGDFNVTDIGDTYFNLSGYSKGVVFVNGKNLGRFWNIGPQQKIFCPANWLKKGNNEILVFDFYNTVASDINTETTLE